MAYAYNRHKQAAEWASQKLRVNKKYKGGIGHFFPRGAIVLIDFGENIGFEKNGSRPGVVVSLDANNQTNGNVVVVPLTKLPNKSGRLLKSQYCLYKNKYTLDFDSVVQCEDIRVVSKARLGNVICFVDESDMKNIDKRLKYLLNL